MRTQKLKAAVEEAKRLEETPETHPLMQANNGLGYVVFKRTYARSVEGEDRTEEWFETVERVVLGAQDIGAGLNEAEEVRLFWHIWNVRGFPGGRMLWQLGTPNIERLGGDSLVNCWYTDLKRPSDLGWMMDRLMLGGGVGFSVDNAQWRVAEGGDAILREGFDVDYVVPDNREGWRDLCVKAVEAHLTGETFTYSVDAIRPAGADIKTFGGKASGPDALVLGVDQMQTVMEARRGNYLRSVDVLDLANIIGSIVVSGNVRRSAQIALGDPFDQDFMEAKRWDLGGIPNWRAMSNNSVVVNSKLELMNLPEEFWSGYRGNGEAYGLVNVQAARTWGRYGDGMPDASIKGFNPCAEIALADRESCNLAELVLPNFSDQEEMEDCAVLLYKVQKAVAALTYLDPGSDAITNTNMRLGLGVTGVMQASFEQTKWLRDVYKKLREFDRYWSNKKGYPQSVRLTTVKPSGTLSLLAGVTPGGHPAFARFHIRRVRMAANDPVLAWCQKQGYPWEWQRGFDGVPDTKTAVVEFPVEVAEATYAENVSAIDQLEVVRWLQRDWADNAVSVTVYYNGEELADIREYLEEHWGQFKSVSFLLREDHGFDQAPLERITSDEYRRRLAVLKLHAEQVQGEALEILDSDCATGACPVR